MPKPADVVTAGTLKPNWAVLAGLRFGLALIVAAAHLGGVTGFGGTFQYWGLDLGSLIAVYMFFVVSGISIAHSIHTRPKGFYWRRAKRLWPTSLLVLAGTLIMHAWLGRTLNIGLIHAHEANAPVILASAFMLIGITVHGWSTVGQMWSLGVEIIFYAFAPLFLRLTKKQLEILIAASVGCFLYGGSLQINGYPGYVGYWNPASFAWLWLGGWYLYLYPTGQSKYLFTIVAMALTTWNNRNMGTLPMFTSGTAMAVLCYGNVITLPKQAERVLLYLGDLSFPLYLCHPLAYVVIGTLQNRGTVPAGGSPLFLSALVLSVVVLHLTKIRLPRLSGRDLDHRQDNAATVPV